MRKSKRQPSAKVVENKNEINYKVASGIYKEATKDTRAVSEQLVHAVHKIEEFMEEVKKSNIVDMARYVGDAVLLQMAHEPSMKELSEDEKRKLLRDVCVKATERYMKDKEHLEKWSRDDTRVELAKQMIRNLE